MKKIYIQFLVAFTAFTMVSSCTEVVDVDVPEAEPRLVIEASLDWDVTNAGNQQMIRLSRSTPYFATNQIDPVTGAMVVVINNTTQQMFDFEDMNDGTYTTNSFIPTEEDSFTLRVTYDGETYEATESYVAPTEILYTEQGYDIGFDDDVIGLQTYFQDDASTDNFYYFNYDREGDLFPYLDTFSDEFTNGNVMFDIFEIWDDDDSDIEVLQPGDVLTIRLYSISESYYNYLDLLLSQADNAGNPFATTPAALQGNCRNVGEGLDAYGYFRTTRVALTTYTVE